MATFIEFPVFYGVSGDLRQWILWLEDFFVRERFTADEKMNLAQSLLEGEAETWFYRSQKGFSFQSWEHLQDLLIWKFGDFSDPELFLLWEKNDRILQEQRVEQRRNIASQLKLPNTKVHVSDSENLRNIEPRTENSVLDNFGTVLKKAKIQQNIRMDVVNGDVERIQRVLSITKNVSAHQVLDKMCQLKGLETKKKMKVLKSWMFKYKPGKRRSRKRHNQDGVYTWSRRESRKNKSAKLRILSTIEYIHDIESSAANVSTFQSNKSSDASSLVIDVKDYSKYGTVIKTDLGHGEKVHELPSQEKILKDGDVITFGTGLATYRLSSIPLVFYFCTSSETFKVDQSVQAAVSSIGAHLSLPWSEECTHVLIEPRMQVKLELCAGHEKGISGENHGLLVFPWNLMLLEFFLFFHLEDKVCLSGASNRWWGWLVFDRGKDHIILGDVMTLVFLDNVEVGSKGLAFDGCVILGMNCAGFGRGKAELLATCQQMQRTDLFSFCCSCKNHLIVSEFEKKKQMLGDMTRMFKYKSRLQDINLIDTQFLCEKVHRVSCLSLAAQFNSLELIQAVLEKIIQGDQEASTKIIDKLQIKLQQGMDLHGASWHCFSDEMNQIHSPIGLVDALYSDLGENVHTLLAAEVHESGPGQRKFSSIWHRWRRKD